MGLQHWWIREDVINLDLCKAFGTVPQDRAGSKLERCGFDRWAIIKNWLDGHTKRVEVNCSNVQVETSGVTQRSVLGLALINTFVRNKNNGIECALSNFSRDQAV